MLSFRRSLSVRLLVLTAFFVLVAEVLIFTPSIARYRRAFLEERLASAHLAALAIDAAPDFMVTKPLEQMLLHHVGAWSIEVTQPGMRVHMLSTPMPPRIDARFVVEQGNWWRMTRDAVMVLAGGPPRVIEVEGPSPKDPTARVAVVMDEAPMVAAMIAYSGRMLTVSVVISLLTAGLLYVSLDRLLVRPMRRIVASMTAFRADPEFAPPLFPSRRHDEVGVAEHELVDLQHTVRTALRQQARLAALGQAVVRVNHDLRGILATASLISERLTGSGDPEVRRAAARLLETIDRAADLCSRTLSYSRDGLPPFQPVPVVLDTVVAAVIADLPDPAVCLNRIPEGLQVSADADQLARALGNLVVNAVQCGADQVTLRGRVAAGRVQVTVADNGPGLAPRAQAHLFQPFAGSARPGGTGLGLAIAREIIRAHGGDVRLEQTGPSGTCFSLDLPLADQRSRATAGDRERRAESD
ncbi:MAG: HAMP domain-containing sensor histidine kinase [Azospirillaceae bacterium]|nr:HAMP domain-containing sensor histidine kinase [Azospirillaceae bacterium]